MTHRLVFVIVPLLGACTSLEPGSTTDRASVEVTGSLERVDPDNPRSSWAGSELVVVFDPAGAVMCEADIDLDGEATHGGEDCDGCTLVVDLLRDTLAEVGQDCRSSWDPQLVERSDSLLSYGPTDDRSRTSVRIADQVEGPWLDYADGWYSEGSLVYRRKVYVGTDTDLDTL